MNDMHRWVIRCLLVSQIMFRGSLLESQFSSPLPFTSFCSTPLPAQTPLLDMGMRQNPFGTPQLGLLFGRLPEQSPPTGHEPKNLTESAVKNTCQQAKTVHQKTKAILKCFRLPQFHLLVNFQDITVLWVTSIYS